MWSTLQHRSMLYKPVATASKTGVMLEGSVARGSAPCSSRNKAQASALALIAHSSGVPTLLVAFTSAPFSSRSSTHGTLPVTAEPQAQPVQTSFTQQAK